MKTTEAVGTTTGAIAGGAGIIVAVAAAGILGLSAAGLTNGLAAVGGGAMLGGLAVVAAALLAIGALGYGLVRQFSRD